MVGTGVGKSDLCVGVGHCTVGYHLQVLEYLHVALVGVHDDIEVFIGAKHFGEDVAERFFQHTYHSGFVDVFEFLKFGKTLHHVRSFYFLSHLVVYLIGVFYMSLIINVSEFDVICHALGVGDGHGDVLFYHFRALLAFEFDFF